MLLRLFIVLALLASSCAEPEPKSPNSAAGADAEADANSAADMSGQDIAVGNDTATVADVSTPPDLPAQPAYCATASSDGFFPDCAACDESGGDCDTIDAPGASGKACGCSGGCPCGLRCGSYEIAPNITVGNICVR